jgi:hypothetical protein
MIRPKNIRLNWVAIALFGTTLVFITIGLPILWQRGALTRGRLLEKLWLLAFFSFIILAIMAVVWSIGFIYRRIRKEIDEPRVVLD